MLLPSPGLLSLGLTNGILLNFIATYPYTVLNVPQDVISDFVENSFDKHYGFRLGPKQTAFLWGFFVCLWDIGGVIGAFVTAVLDERFGRKDTLFIFNNIFHLFACALTILSKSADSFELLFVGRLIFGISSGVSATSMGVFVTECSPDRYRGFLGNFSLCFQPLICMVSMVLGLPQFLGDAKHWAYLLSFSGCISLIVLIMSPFFKESPKYLHIERGNTEQAIESIKFYHGRNQLTEESIRAVIDEYDKESDLAGGEAPLSRIISTKHLRIPLLLSVVANLAQDTIGSDVVSNYSTDILESLSGDGPSTRDSERSMITTVITLVPGVVSAFAATALAEVVGRKFLLVAGLSGATAANAILMTTGFCRASLLEKTYGRAMLLWTSAIAIGVFNFSYYFGPASVPQYIYGEITPTAARATVAAAAMVANYGGSVIYSLFYPWLAQAIGSYSFLFTILPTVVCMAILIAWLPEPKGKSVDEIVALWTDTKQHSAEKRTATASGDDVVPLLDSDTDADF